MNTQWSQSPDQPLPIRDVMAALYWETMYNDGNDTSMYPCPGQSGNDTGSKSSLYKQMCHKRIIISFSGPCKLAPANQFIMYVTKLLGVPRYAILKLWVTCLCKL